jgi:hypothetical protein
MELTGSAGTARSNCAAGPARPTRSACAALTAEPGIGTRVGIHASIWLVDPFAGATATAENQNAG